MSERTNEERREGLPALDEYDPDEALALLNEVLDEDDANDPLLESYQKYKQRP